MNAQRWMYQNLLGDARSFRKVLRKCVFIGTGSPNSTRKLTTSTVSWSVSLRICHRRFSDRALIPKRSSQMTFRRGFRVKSDKTEANPEKIKTEPHTAKSQPEVIKTGTASPKAGPGLWSFVFKTGALTVGFSAIAFGGSALWQQENVRRRHEEFWNQGLRKQRPQKRGEVRENFNDVWNHLSTAHKVTYGIMGINLLVWGCWKFANPRMMEAWFTLKQFPLRSSVSKISHHFANMLLSMFSHKGAIHLYVNMYVLSSFAAAWRHMTHSAAGDASLNGPERFVAFYLTAGMASSFLSSILKVVGRIPQPSLGASGAILGLIGYVCEKMPNNMLSIVFIPDWAFSAGSAKNFILGFDIIGLIIGAATGWRSILFDHAGHLGGMLFGIWYARYGETLLDKYCRYIADLSKRK